MRKDAALWQLGEPGTGEEWPMVSQPLLLERSEDPLNAVAAWGPAASKVLVFLCYSTGMGPD